MSSFCTVQQRVTSQRKAVSKLCICVICQFAKNLEFIFIARHTANLISSRLHKPRAERQRQRCKLVNFHSFKCNLDLPKKSVYHTANSVCWYSWSRRVSIEVILELVMVAVSLTPIEMLTYSELMKILTKCLKSIFIY